MSTESSKAILRQWHIIWYLVGGHYVSTSNIREHLQTLGVEVELRTIQRDLNMLEKVLPIYPSPLKVLEKVSEVCY